MSNEDYQRGLLHGQLMAGNNPFGNPFAGLGRPAMEWTFRVAPFLSVLWFWGFYPMVAAVVGVIAVRSVSSWRDRLWVGKGRWVILAALALLPILGHTALGIPAAASLSQHQGPAVHGKKAVK